MTGDLEQQPLGSTPWRDPEKWLGFLLGSLLIVIGARELIG